MTLTQARLKELLSYDPDTGVFTWLPSKEGKGRPFKSRKAGGLNEEGYRRIWIDGRFYGAGRIAYLYMTGEWPPIQIDHRNRIPDDDRWSNLRPATQTENKANSGVYRNNLLGTKGVRLHRNGQYEARLRFQGKLVYLGCYRTVEEASVVYAAAALEKFGAFASSPEPEVVP